MKIKIKAVLKRVKRIVNKIRKKSIGNKVAITKTVGSNGSDFDSISSAIKWANSNFKYIVTIYIKNGVYNECNLILDRNEIEYIKIIGESKDSVVIRVDGNTMPELSTRDKSGLFAATNCNVSNLTIDVNEVKYCVHNDENSGSYDVVFSNCRFIHRGCEDNSFYFPVGIGARSNQNNEFIDCEFEYSNEVDSPVYGIFWHNWNNQKDSAKLQVVRGKFINCGVAHLAELGSNQKDECTFEDCQTDLLDRGIFLSAIAGYYKTKESKTVVKDPLMLPYNILVKVVGSPIKIENDSSTRAGIKKVSLVN